MKQEKTPLHILVFLLFVLLFPTQISLHFWPDFAYVFGIRVDYLAPAIYLADIVLFVLFALWSFSGFKLDGLGRALRSSLGVLVVGVIIYLFTNSLFVAQNQGAAFYNFLRTLEYFWLFFYIFTNRQLIFSRRIFYNTLSLAVLYSSAIALAQFIFQRSLGGIFWWLGERTFNASTPGIATVFINNQDILRPYGTFSHPNSMAGFLLVSLLFILPFDTLLKKTALAAGGLIILLSFSRSAWAAILVLLLIFFLYKKVRPSHLFAGIFLLITLLTAIPLWFAPGVLFFGDDLVRRVELARAGFSMILHSPFFGVGLNNFVPSLPKFAASPAVSWWLQPVHNIFLLLISEIGIIGFCLLLYLVTRLIAPIFTQNKKRYLLLVAILFTGSIDHYWLTLEQNLLLATVVFGFLASTKKD